MSATVQTARKEYKFQHCGGLILKGQTYYKRMEAQKVHCQTSYYPLCWHKNKAECQPHYKKDNCNAECKTKEEVKA